MARTGIHWPNCDIDDDETRRIFELGATDYTLLHYQADRLQEIRAHTAGIILARYFDKGLLAKPPNAYAQAVATEAGKWRQYTHDVVFANEPNLRDEAGDGHDDPDRVARWCVDVAAELRRLCPWLRIHAPAFSPQGNWTEYLRRLALHPNLFDVYDLHAYGTYSQIVETVRQARVWLSEAALFVSEYNGEGSIEFARWCAAQRILATYYIWRWANPDLPGWARDLMGSALEGQIKELAKEGSMSRAAIAIIPSNQDKNQSKIIPAYTEMGGMHWLTPLIEQVLLNAGFNARGFLTEPQSADTYHLENLIKQTEAAHAWLSQQPEGVKFAVNLHTDSGDFSHTFGIYGSTREAESAKIASLLSETVHEAMGTAEFRAFDKLGTNDYNSYVFHALAKFPAVLIEICSHENRRDIEALWTNPGAVAQGILKGVQQYVGAGGVDWKAEAAAYRDKLRDVTAALERERARVASVKEFVAKA